MAGTITFLDNTDKETLSKGIAQNAAAIAEEEGARQRAVAAERSERQAEIAVERARLNNMANLPEGSTAGDAELADMRVDSDGVVHENAGDAMRDTGRKLKLSYDDMARKLLARLTDCFVFGKNLYDPDAALYGYRAEKGGVPQAMEGWVTTDFIPYQRVGGTCKYILSSLNKWGSEMDGFYLMLYDENHQWLNTLAGHMGIPFSFNDTVEPHTRCAYMRISYMAGLENVQLEVGDTATAYEPYRAPYIEQVHVNGNFLPDATEENNGKFPKIVNGKWVLTPEYHPIPIVDTVLDVTSWNPLANMTAAREFIRINEAIRLLNEGGLQIKDDVIAQQITGWLKEHPEATTTVQDHSLTIDKMVVGTLGYVTPQMFGAVGDGVVDDTAAIQAAVNAHLNVYIPSGTYLVNGKYNDWTDPHMGGIKLRSGQRLHMAADCTIQVATNDGAFYNAISVYQCKDVEIRGGKIVGERQTHTNTAASLQGYGIDVIESENVLIDNVDISEMRGDAIIVNGIYDTVDGVTQCMSEYSNGITIQNCNLHDCERQGITVLAGNNVVMNNNSFHDITGSAPRSGIDIEPLDDCDDVHGITIQNCTFVGCTQSFCFSKCYDVTIDNCLFSTGVVAVHDARDVNFHKCTFEQKIDISENCEVSFYACDIAITGHNAPGLDKGEAVSYYYDCHFHGGMAVALDLCVVAGAGEMYFKNCEFLFTVQTDKASFVYGSKACRFDGCTFVTVGGAVLRFLNGTSPLEFNNCRFDVNCLGAYPYMFLNIPLMVMQNCYVKTNGYVWTYSAPMDSSQILASGNIFSRSGTEDYVLHIGNNVTITEQSIAFANNTCINSSNNFVRNWSKDAVTVTEINNNNI